MVSRECGSCGARWPEGFTHCPACARPTRIVVGMRPTRTKRQALSAEFERRYAEREQQRIADGLVAPEGLGRREARELIELERRLR